jgi:hypothetical protein
MPLHRLPIWTGSTQTASTLTGGSDLADV